MEWMQLFIAIITIGGMFLWARTESRQDVGGLQKEVKNLESKIDKLVTTIHVEMRDFHGRLCTLEEKSKK